MIHFQLHLLKSNYVAFLPASIPPKLKFLTLSRTSLDWGHVSILGSLGGLEMLKVKDKASLITTFSENGKKAVISILVHLQGR